MKVERLYPLGLVVVGVLAGLLILSRPEADRPGMWLGLGAGLAAQGPLGWWLVRAVGTPRFVGVWALGMLARFSVLGIMAFGVFPRTGRPVGPGLLMLAGVLIVLLFFEGAVVWLNQRSKA